MNRAEASRHFSFSMGFFYAGLLISHTIVKKPGLRNGVRLSKHPNRQLHNWLHYRSLEHALKSHANLLRGTVCDLGCGESPYRDFVVDCGATYVGVDWSSSLHALTADIVADLNRPTPIASGSFDVILSLSVLEHLREPQVMLREAARILRPGGDVILQVPWQWAVHEAPEDYFRYSPYALEKMLGDAGFEQVEVKPQNGFFSALVMKLNYFTARFVRGPAVLQWLLRFLLLPFWFLGQVLAPLLDRLDRNWCLETTGYFVTARVKKPAATT